MATTDHPELDQLRGLLPEDEIAALAAMLTEAEEGARDPAVRRRWAREDAERRALDALAARRERERSEFWQVYEDGF